MQSENQNLEKKILNAISILSQSFKSFGKSGLGWNSCREGMEIILQWRNNVQEEYT